jgi:hypothetical protein
MVDRDDKTMRMHAGFYSHGLIIVGIYSARETFPREGDTENAFYEEGERYATFF